MVFVLRIRDSWCAGLCTYTNITVWCTVDAHLSGTSDLAEVAGTQSCTKF